MCVILYEIYIERDKFIYRSKDHTHVLNPNFVKMVYDPINTNLNNSHKIVRNVLCLSNRYR